YIISRNCWWWRCTSSRNRWETVNNINRFGIRGGIWSFRNDVTYPFYPPQRPKLQCFGVPAFDVDARIIEPSTNKELDVNQEGELIVNGPQLFKGYYN